MKRVCGEDLAAIKRQPEECGRAAVIVRSAPEASRQVTVDKSQSDSKRSRARTLLSA